MTFALLRHCGVIADQRGSVLCIASSFRCRTRPGRKGSTKSRDFVFVFVFSLYRFSWSACDSVSSSALDSGMRRNDGFWGYPRSVRKGLWFCRGVELPRGGGVRMCPPTIHKTSYSIRGHISPLCSSYAILRRPARVTHEDSNRMNARSQNPTETPIDPRNLTFSQANGYEEIPGPLNLEELPQEARTHMWKVVYENLNAAKYNSCNEGIIGFTTSLHNSEVASKHMISIKYSICFSSSCANADVHESSSKV